MLPLSVGGWLAAGCLWNGSGDVRSCFVVLAGVVAAFGAALAASIVRGRLSLPQGRMAAWAAGLAATGFISARLSATPIESLEAWVPIAAGLAIFPIVDLLSFRGRAEIDRALSLAAWGIVTMVAYQRFHSAGAPTGPFAETEFLAGAVLLLLPIAYRRSAWALFIGLVLCLWWSRCAGAWFALACAIVLSRRSIGGMWIWLGAAAGAIAAALTMLHIGGAVAWAAGTVTAWRAAFSTPWIGLGSGAFARAAGARPGVLWPVHPRPHLLGMAADYGLIYFVFWAAGVLAMLRRADASRRFGALAVMIQALCSDPLLNPAVFWLFCFAVAGVQPESERVVYVTPARRPAGIIAAAIVCVSVVMWLTDGARAAAARAAGARIIFTKPDAAERVLEFSERLRPHPDTARLRAMLALSRAIGADERIHLENAARHLEQALSLNPYAAEDWRTLELILNRLGKNAEAAGVRARALRARPQFVTWQT